MVVTPAILSHSERLHRIHTTMNIDDGDDPRLRNWDKNGNLGKAHVSRSLRRESELEQPCQT